MKKNTNKNKNMGKLDEALKSITSTKTAPIINIHNTNIVLHGHKCWLKMHIGLVLYGIGWLLLTGTALFSYINVR